MNTPYTDKVPDSTSEEVTVRTEWPRGEFSDTDVSTGMVREGDEFLSICEIVHVKR